MVTVTSSVLPLYRSLSSSSLQQHRLMAACIGGITRVRGRMDYLFARCHSSSEAVQQPLLLSARALSENLMEYQSDLIDGDQVLPYLATDNSNYLIRKVTCQITAKGKFDSDAYKRQFSINWD